MRLVRRSPVCSQVSKSLFCSPKAFSPRFYSSSSDEKKDRVMIVGGGLMGSGIATVAASAGYPVTLVEMNQVLVEKAQKAIESNISRGMKKSVPDEEERVKRITDVLKNVSYSLEPNEAVKNSDIVIEAIVENMEQKQALFSGLDKAAPASTIFASNTSSFSIGKIANATSRPDRFGGIHFFSPVPVMKLVEVIKTEETTEETFNKLKSFGLGVGKTAISCKDTPGFIVNRLLVPYLMESVRLVERGDATVKDVDTGMMLGAGHPMGPFTLADFVGLDVTKFIIDGWHKEYPDEPLFKPSALLNKFVEEGKLGRKTGEGFYNYKK